MTLGFEIEKKTKTKTKKPIAVVNEMSAISAAFLLISAQNVDSKSNHFGKLFPLIYCLL